MLILVSFCLTSITLGDHLLIERIKFLKNGYRDEKKLKIIEFWIIKTWFHNQINIASLEISEN